MFDTFGAFQLIKIFNQMVIVWPQSQFCGFAVLDILSLLNLALHISPCLCILKSMFKLSQHFFSFSCCKNIEYDPAVVAWRQSSGLIIKFSLPRQFEIPLRTRIYMVRFIVVLYTLLWCTQCCQRCLMRRVRCIGSEVGGNAGSQRYAPLYTLSQGYGFSSYVYQEENFQ